MKFLCLGYYDEKKFDAMPKDEVDALVRNCRTHDEGLHQSGHLIAVASLGPTRTTKSVRPKQGKASVTDGPFAETKEQLGGFLVLEASDLNEAIRLMSQHPCLRLGSVMELRPINEELTQRLAERCAAAAQC